MSIADDLRHYTGIGTGFTPEGMMCFAADEIDRLNGENTALKAQVNELREALQLASDHLDYCGYGDSYERECARESKLEEKIEQALSVLITASDNQLPYDKS